VPCDGKRHTAEFKDFKIALTPNAKYSISVSVACGTSSTTSDLTIQLDANGLIDPALSDQDGDGKLDKDDKDPSEPE
jgi:hypothetical protein